MTTIIKVETDDDIVISVFGAVMKAGNLTKFRKQLNEDLFNGELDDTTYQYLYTATDQIASLAK